jgi:hypothetical protein
LIIVTKASLEGFGSQSELKPWAGQPAGSYRRIAVRRESVDERLLMAHLPGVQSVDWFPDDPDPDARFWEIYCALMRTPAGDRCDWSRNGRNLLGDWNPGPEGSDATACLDCPSRPVLAQPAAGWTLLVTDTGGCFQVDRGEPPALHPLPDLEGFSAVAVDPTGRLFVGFYEGMVATPRDGDWAYRPADAPVLSLAASARGLALGDALGSIMLRDFVIPKDAKVVAGEPVVDLIAFDEEFVALGGRGGLWRVCRMAGDSISLSPVSSNEALGRPVGLFSTGDPARVGVFSSERLALLGRELRSLTVGVRRIPDGITAVARFGSKPETTNPPPLGILTDTGQVWIASADLKTIAAVVPPEESREIVGLAPGPAGWLLAWSAGGTLLGVGRDRGVRTLATGHVALAYTEPDLPDRVATVQWEPEKGVQVRRLWLESAR